jgi:hypothetical protein
MNKYFIFCLLLLLLIFPQQAISQQRHSITDFNRKKTFISSSNIKKRETMLIADFNRGRKKTNLKTKFDTWDKDPGDLTQWCKLGFTIEERMGDSGKALKIKYDVDSPYQAFNGLWFQLNNLDASEYKRFILYVKGDKKRGFTKTFKVELKNRSQTGYYLVTRVKNKWKKISIPLKKFKGISNFSSLTELTIVFEDNKVTKKTGTIYIDDIGLEA